MPELPEVENLRRYLIRERVIGRTFSAVDVRWPGARRAHDGKGGLAALAGRRVVEIGRHGKNLFVCLDQGFLHLHMGMTGSLAIRRPDQPAMRFAHTTFVLDDGRRIEIDDPRKWASAVLIDHVSEVTGSLGPDALDPSFTADEFVRRVRPKRSPIKAVLMDQHVLAGVGNIYADEALFRAKIAPGRLASRVSEARLRYLHTAVRQVIAHSADFIGSHLLEDGRPFVVDAYDARMRLVRKAGSKCPECGLPLKIQKYGGRTAYFCGRCQR